MSVKTATLGAAGIAAVAAGVVLLSLPGGRESETGGAPKSASKGTHTMLVQVMNMYGEQPCYGDGEVWVDILRDGQGDPVDTRGLRIINNKATRILIEGPAVYGDHMRFENLAAGTYLVVATAKRHVEMRELVTVSFARGQPVAEAMKIQGYFVGAEGHDEKGGYEVISVSEPTEFLEDAQSRDGTAGDVRRFKTEMVKRYYISFATSMWTHIAPDEGTDMVLAVVPSPPNDQAEAWLRTVRVTGAKFALAKAFPMALTGGGRSGKPPKNPWVTVHSDLVMPTGDDRTKVMKIAAAGAGALVEIVHKSGGSEARFLVTIIGAGLMPPQVNPAAVSVFAASDDFTATPTTPAAIRKDSGSGQIEVVNEGQPLYNLVVQCEVETPRGPTWIDASQELRFVLRGQRQKLDWTVSPSAVSGAAKSGRLSGRLRLAYRTEPESGIITQQYRDLMPFPVGREASGSGPLIIESIRSSIESTPRGPFEPFCVVSIRNTGREPAKLRLTEPGSGATYTQAELDFHRRNTPGFAPPHGLAIEMLFPWSRSWSTFNAEAFAWRHVDEPDEGLGHREALIVPGQVKRFRIQVAHGIRFLHTRSGRPVSGLLPMPIAFRVFIVSDGHRRTEEKSISFQYPFPS